MVVYFQYGVKEIAHLRKADKRLAEVIDRVGIVQRPVIPDLFAALVHSIVGQQISTKAHQTVWERMLKKLGEISPEIIDGLALETLHAIRIRSKFVFVGGCRRSGGRNERLFTKKIRQ